jgi:hypothetical protein
LKKHFDELRIKKKKDRRKIDRNKKREDDWKNREE